MENSHLSDNALDTEVTSNDVAIEDVTLNSALQAAGFADLDDAYAQTSTGSLEELQAALAQQVDLASGEDNPILKLIRALGRLVGIGKKRRGHKRYRNQKKLRKKRQKTLRDNRNGARKSMPGSHGRKIHRPKKTKPKPPPVEVGVPQALTIEFKGDRPSFRGGRRRAKRNMRDIVEWLLAHPRSWSRIVIRGNVANLTSITDLLDGGPFNGQPARVLMEARATAIVNLLVRMGVPRKKIINGGAGIPGAGMSGTIVVQK